MGLEEYKGIHPRLFLTDEKVNKIKSKDCKRFADRVITMADSVKVYPEHTAEKGENLWQREVGNMMPYLAMAYLLTEDQKYLVMADKWVINACNYPIWYGTLGAGHLLFGSAIVYDWLYMDLPVETREIILKKLLKEGPRDLPENLYLQNHLWVSSAGIGAAGLAIYDEVNEGKVLIERTLNEFKHTMNALGPDGASHEGVGYWQYGVEYMLKFMYLAREILNVNMYNHSWWKNTAYYGLYLTTPRNGWKSGGPHGDFADCPRYNWYGPDYLYRALATEYDNGYAQWLAKENNEAGMDNPQSTWLNLIWYDSNIMIKHPQDLPTLRHFEDMGIVSARSDWSGDESLVVFKCGPAIGHYATDRYSYNPGDNNYLNRNCSGHVHPDTNHFVIFGNGEWLVRNAGYVKRRTDYQNNLLVDGKGHYGQCENWWDSDYQVKDNLHPRIKLVESHPDFHYIAGQGADAYPDCLAKFDRYLLFIKPDVLIVIDDIESNNSDISRNYKLLFHLEHKATNDAHGLFRAMGKKTKLNIELLTKEDVKVFGENQKIHARNVNSFDNRFVVSMSINRVKWRNAVGFSWSSIEHQPNSISFHDLEDVWVFDIGNSKISFNWNNKKCELH